MIFIKKKNLIKFFMRKFFRNNGFCGFVNFDSKADIYKKINFWVEF